MSTAQIENVETLQEALNAITALDGCELPMLPEVAAQLLKLTSKVDCEVSAIVALIKRDQSLTSHLLRIANTLRYSTGITVSSIQQAVARLGLNSVREIVVLISCQCRIFDVAGFEKDVRQSFRKSLTAAAFSQEIARIRRMNVEEAFLAGLLHDVGRPILLQALSDRRRQGVLSSSDDELRVAAEEHRIGLAARLIASWELPSRVAETVRFQNAAFAARDQELQSAMLSLAIDIATATLAGREIINGSFDEHPMAALVGLYPEQLANVLRHRQTILEWVDSTT